MAANNTPLERNQYLTFHLGEEAYGVPVLRVKEIIEYDVLTKLPGATDSVRGVINLRGNVVPVLDLLRRFQLGDTPITSTTCVVVVEMDIDGETAYVGLLTDAVDQVVDLGKDDIERPPAFGAGLRIDYLTGMGKLPQKKFLMILDIDKVLTVQDTKGFLSAERAAETPAKK